MTRAFPVLVAGQNGIRRIFLPWSQQGTRSRRPKRILAADATTPVSRIKQIKPVLASEDERPLHQTAFPAGVIANQFPRFSHQLGSVVVQTLCPDWRWPAAAVSVFLPNEITGAIRVGGRNRINRAVLL